MNITAASRSRASFDVAWVAVAAVLAAVSLHLQSYQALSHDCAWYLVAASAWLDGSRVYAETAVDPNPPMVVWMSAALVGGGRALHIAPAAMLRAFAIAACVIAALFSGEVLRAAKVDARLRFTALASFLTVTLSTAHREFGQREHIVTALVLPYLCLSDRSGARRGAPSFMRALCGLLLGLALCLKPQYILLPAAMILLRILARAPLGRWLTWAEIIAASAVAGYLALALATAPAYFTVALPLAGAVYYAAYAGSIQSVLVAAPSADLVLLAAVAVTAWATWRRPPSAERSLAISLCVGGAAAFGAFVVQRTGWAYQVTPARVLLSVALLYSLALLVSQRSPVRLSKTCVLIVAAAGAFAVSRFARDYRRRALDLAATETIHRAIGTASAPAGFAALSTSLEPAFPAALYVGQWSLRYPCLWMLPAVIMGSARDGTGAFHPSEPVRRIDEEMRQHVLADFERHRPGLVLVDRSPTQQALPVHVDLLKYFQQAPPFQRFWEQYRACGGSNEFALYCRSS